MVKNFFNYGTKTVVLLSFFLLLTACSRSIGELYVRNLSILENIKGKPVYLEETSSHGVDTARFFYFPNGQCSGWEMENRFFQTRRSIEYDGRALKKYSEVFTSKFERNEYSYTVNHPVKDSIVILNTDNSLVCTISKNKMLVIFEDGEVQKSLLDTKGRIISSEDKVARRDFSYNRRGDLTHIKYIDKESDEISEYHKEYLSWDRKGNWTTKIEYHNDETDTVTRVICYSEKERLALRTSQEEARRIMAKEYLDKNFSEFSPWTITTVSNIDSLVTPFMDLCSIRINLAELSGKMYKAYSMREYNEINQRAKLFIGFLSDATEKLDNPEGPNKIGLDSKLRSKEVFLKRNMSLTSL